MNTKTPVLIIFLFLSFLTFSCSEKEGPDNGNTPADSSSTTDPSRDNGEVSEKSLLWSINGKGLEKPSYLFGTIHLICEEDFFMPDSAESKLKEAEIIAFELDMDDPATLMGMTGKMNMRNDTVLSDLLSEEDFDMLAQWFQDSLKVDIKSIEGQKPFVLTSMLYPKMMQCKNLSSFEGFFMQKAREFEKEIIGLESVEYQMSIFDSIPYSLQAEELVNMIEDWDSTILNLSDLLSSFKEEDIEKAATSFEESSPGMEDFEEVLLQNRNKMWISRIDSIVHAQSTFIAVGAGHLGGEEGVINLLRQEGYEVEPVK